MPHPIVGALVAARLADGYRLALVERVRFPRKGDPAPRLHVRLHGGPDTLAEGNFWETIVGRYRGHREEIPVTHVRRVLPGEGEGWVDAADFFEWAES